MPDVKANIEQLVGQLPDPDEKGMLSKIDASVVDTVTATIWEGGSDAIIALIDLLVEPAIGDKFKPHYALHCVVLHACKQQRAQKRRLGEILAEQLDSNRPKAVRGYLIRELQFFADRSAVEALGKTLSDSDLIDDAACALMAIGGDAAVTQLRTALPKAKGKAKLIILQNLCIAGDAESTDAMKAALADSDREIRLTAVCGLANIADTKSIDAVLKAADVDAGHERTKATQACLVMAENLAAKDDKSAAAKIYKHLAKTRTGDDEAYVRDAAEDALTAISA